MNIDTAFPSKYLRAADLGDATPTVTISHVEMEQVAQGKDRQPVVYFEGKSKGVVLNKTNSQAIKQIAGTPETEQWTGTRVQLYVAEVQFKSETVEAIRIRAPKGSKPAPPPEPVDEFVDDQPF